MTAARFGDLDSGQVRDLDRDAERAELAGDRDSFRTPALHTLERPSFTPLRTAGMLALRGYLLVAVVLVVVKIVESIG